MAYTVLQKLFHLPCTSTLKDYLRKIHVKPGFQKQILEGMKSKGESLSRKVKYCTVVFDDMGVREHLAFDFSQDQVMGLEDYGQLGKTEHAGVFLGHGLFESWMDG